MKPIEELCNEVCYYLAKIEQNGVKIDLNALNALESDYRKEHAELKQKITRAVCVLMGDCPFNLNSPEDLSIIVYSRRLKDKKLWCKYFNLGTEFKYGKRIQKKRVVYKPKVFAKLVNGLTEIEVKKKVEQCVACNGKGRINKLTALGKPYKNSPKCQKCVGKGVIYRNIEPLQIAGLKIIPKNVNDLSALGFSTNKEKLEELAKHAETTEAKDFLQALVRINAIEHYLSNFVDGIRKNISGDGLLHAEFMPCVTATGRLASRNPNFHNQPRGKTFPIRRVVVSRWKGGSITEGDFAQLEFRIAAELSRCEIAAKDISDGVDAHQNSANILTKAGQPTDRQEAKPHTFKPLYGGMSGTKAEQTYYRAFLERYKGIAAWHDKLCSQAVRTKWVALPSGRSYNFPYARQYPNGSVLGKTKIVNYPVQGFATADIVPLAFVLVSRIFEQESLQSRIINEVHDSIVVDTFPGEEESVGKILYHTMKNIDKEIYNRFNYQMVIPLDVEIKNGPNWLDLKKSI